jgi:hypothetical protein
MRGRGVRRERFGPGGACEEVEGSLLEALSGGEGRSGKLSWALRPWYLRAPWS